MTRLAAALVLAATVCVSGVCHAQHFPDRGSQDRVSSFKSAALAGDVTLRLAQAGEVASSDNQPVAVLLMLPEESALLLEEVVRCGRDRAACDFSFPAYRVTFIMIDPAEVTGLAATRPDPERAAAVFLGAELPTWVFENVQPDETMLMVGSLEAAGALGALLRSPGAYDEVLLLEPELGPEVAEALMSVIPPDGGETTNIDIYAHGWTPGDDLAAETLINAMLDGPFHIGWIEPDDQAMDPDGARRAFTLGVLWRFAAIPPW